MSDVATIQSGDFTVTSTGETEQSLRDEFAKHSPEPDTSEAASVLGKKGGEATAAKRAAEAKEAKRQAKDAKPADIDPAVGDDGNIADDPETPERADAPTEQPDKKLGKPRHDAIARMQEATRKEAEAKREAREAREEAARERAEASRARAELEAARRGTATPEPPPQRAGADGEPQQGDFDDWQEFHRAWYKWARDKERAEEAQQFQQFNRQQREEAYTGQFARKVNEAAKADPEFWDKASPEIMNLRPRFKLSAEERPYADGGNWIADELVDNVEHAPALILHLSEHPDEFQRIASLQTPRAVTREMAKLVTRLDVATTEHDARPAVSKAKPPVKPVTGAPQSTAAYRDDMTLDEFARTEEGRKARPR